MRDAIRINKYMPIAVLYFFFNGFLLPLGLLYTTILSPFFLIWLCRYRSIRYLWIYLAVTIPFVIIHFAQGVHATYYFRSYILLFSVFVFGLTFYQFLRVCNTLGVIYKRLVIINFILTVVAIIALFIPGLREILWFDGALSSGITEVNRLRLFVYEPSYYSTLLVPIAMYYYLKALLYKSETIIPTIIMVSVPLVLSFSFGVILAMIFSILISLLIKPAAFFSAKKAPIYILAGFSVLIIGLVAALLIFPENIFVQRLNNVLEGRDTSFKGRTFDAFTLAWRIAEMKSTIWGSGLGQIKVLGLELWREFYRYNFTINEIAIPNAVAETLAVFGIIGVCIRLGLEIILFFRTKVYNNYYRLLLFLFVFIYQFSGSFIYNIAEYVIWILAFSPVFSQFDKQKYRLKYPS
jgi:hypothetical protein